MPPVSLLVVEVPGRCYFREKESVENQLGQRLLLTKETFLFSFDHPMQGSYPPETLTPHNADGIRRCIYEPAVGLLRQPTVTRMDNRFGLGNDKSDQPTLDGGGKNGSNKLILR